MVINSTRQSQIWLCHCITSVTTLRMDNNVTPYIEVKRHVNTMLSYFNLTETLSPVYS